MSHELTDAFWRKSVFLRHSPHPRPRPQTPGTLAPNPAPSKAPLAYRSIFASAPHALVVRVGRGRTGGERGPPQASSHGCGGFGVVRPPETWKPNRRTPEERVRRRESRREGLGSHQAQLAQLSDATRGCPSFPLIGPSMEMLIGQFPTPRPEEMPIGSLLWPRPHNPEIP